MFRGGLLAGKRILVTGGGSGLGAAMVRRFMELGAELFICGRRRDTLHSAAESMAKDTGGKVTPVLCDIRVSAAVDEMMSTIWESGPCPSSSITRPATSLPRRISCLLGLPTRSWPRLCMVRCTAR